MADLVQIDGAPRPKADPREVLRIAANLATVCLIGGAVLGAVYLGTKRIAAAGRLANERRALDELLELPAGAPLLAIEQSLDAASERVVYRAARWGDDTATPREQAFALDGQRTELPPPGAREPLGRLFVAGEPAAPLGFVVEGESRGYKNRIRFFVALDAAFAIRGVRVLEHEEDPGLGAEVATAWFTRQYVGRDSVRSLALDVTRDPLPEDWRAALLQPAGRPASEWRAQNTALLERESALPIHAVTGATISSRALTDGVRTSVSHFRRRWALLRPWLEGQP